mgnify:CR=1 FL=1
MIRSISYSKVNNFSRQPLKTYMNDSSIYIKHR